MIEKALIVIIFLYAVGFGILSIQWAVADVFGITLTNFEGTPIKSNLLAALKVENLNLSEKTITNINKTSAVINPLPTAAEVAWELIQLVTGTYIFNILYLLGVPAIAVAGLVGIYFLLVARAFFGYLRGI